MAISNSGFAGENPSGYNPPAPALVIPGGCLTTSTLQEPEARMPQANLLWMCLKMVDLQRNEHKETFINDWIEWGTLFSDHCLFLSFLVYSILYSSTTNYFSLCGFLRASTSIWRENQSSDIRHQDNDAPAS